MIASLQPAIVTALEQDKASLLLADGSAQELFWENGVKQASPYRTENSRGPAPKSMDKVLAIGDLIRVTRLENEEWRLAQVPAAQAALVSLNPNNGAIISIVGGMGF